MEPIIWNPFQDSQRRSDPSTKNISEVIVTVGTPKKSFYDKFELDVSRVRDLQGLREIKWGSSPPFRGIYWGEKAPQNASAGPGPILNFHYATL